MYILKLVPEGVATAVLGAIIAAVGYVAKLLLEWIAEVRATIRVRKARLVELFSLLWAGKVTFDVQNDNRDRLKELLINRKPELASINGYERLFSEAYPDMNDTEKELHSIIRTYTVNTIRPLNESVLKWLKEDTYFKAKRSGNGVKSNLAKRLAHLEAHLLLWQAKYIIWIPDNPSHSLVYLADEEEHGLGFPTGIETDVLEVIKRGSSREWKKEVEERVREYKEREAELQER